MLLEMAACGRYPQGSPFDPDQSHQGKHLADYLRSQGYTVTELPRPTVITSELLAQYDHVIRANQFGQLYTG